jgi:hypothetical protein
VRATVPFELRLGGYQAGRVEAQLEQRERRLTGTLLPWNWNAERLINI